MSGSSTTAPVVWIYLVAAAVLFLGVPHDTVSRARFVAVFAVTSGEFLFRPSAGDRGDVSAHCESRAL